MPQDDFAMAKIVLAGERELYGDDATAAYLQSMVGKDSPITLTQDQADQITAALADDVQTVQMVVEATQAINGDDTAVAYLQSVISDQAIVTPGSHNQFSGHQSLGGDGSVQPPPGRVMISQDDADQIAAALGLQIGVADLGAANQEEIIPE